MKLIKGATLKQQMNHVDRILKGFSGRLHKTVVGLVTPFPISSYSETSEKPIIRYMFPADGKITAGGMCIEGMPKAGVSINITVCSGLECESKVVETKRQHVAISPNLEVKFGSRLIIKVDPVNDGDVVSDIWIAFLWVPAVKDTEVKQFLIDDLLEKREDILKEV